MTEFHTIEAPCEVTKPHVWHDIMTETFLEYFRTHQEFVPVTLFLNKKGAKVVTQVLLVDKSETAPLSLKEAVLRGVIMGKDFNPQAIFMLSAEEVPSEEGPPAEIVVLHEGTPQTMTSRGFKVALNEDDGTFLFEDFPIPDSFRLNLLPKNLTYTL